MSIGREDIIVNKVNCDSTDDFTTVWKKALQGIISVSEHHAIGFEPQTKQCVMDLSTGLAEPIVPNAILTAFRRSNKPMVFIFDEFDRMKKTETDCSFADTMKALSDCGINGTLVLVGVGDAVDDLIASHQSVARSLIQVKVPRMSVDELNGILDKALKELSMEIVDESRDRIVTLSQGLPHYTHLIGREAVRQCLKSQSLEVGLEHVKSAINEAVKNAEQMATTTYQRATSSSHKGNLYKEVLLACALVKGDDLGFFSPGDVRGPLSRIKDKTYEIPQYAPHLANFCSDERGRILTKTGVKHRYRYRFTDPMLRPYVVIRGFLDGLLSEDMFDLIPVWTP